jgi:LacI family transcriptional regulator of maltose regulon
VVVSQSLLDEKCNLVMRDNRQAANLAVRYLIERGHRNIAYIGGREGCLIREQRLLGFRSAMTQNGLVWRDEYSRPAAMTRWQRVCHPPAAGKTTPSPPCSATRRMP